MRMAVRAAAASAGAQRVRQLKSSRGYKLPRRSPSSMLRERDARGSL